MIACNSVTRRGHLPTTKCTLKHDVISNEVELEDDKVGELVFKK